MKNFLKCVVLGILAIAVPVCLTIFAASVAPDQSVAIIGSMVICGMVFYTIYRFMKLGKTSWCYKHEDAFWLSLFVNACAVLILNIVIVIYGCFGGFQNFAQLPFAFAPVTLSLAYAATLGAIVCGMRLHYNGWNMTINDKGLTWSILVLAVVFTACMIIDVCERYLGCYIADFMVTIISSLLVCSICGIVFFACKLIFKQK